MKKVLLAIILVFVLAACGTDSIYNKKDNEPKDDKPETKVVDKEAPEEKFDKTIKLDDELSFKGHRIVMSSVEFYEKKGKIYADVKFDWTNLTGEDFSLQALSKMDVLQKGESLDDVNGDWDPSNSNVLGNDAFFTIKDRLTLSVEFTYELIDAESPLEIVFYAIEEDDKIITIDIN